jgi:hypothetical protein
MLPRVDLSSNSPISAVVRVDATDNTGNPHQDSNLRLDQVAIGKALQAKVVSILTDGTSLVKIQTGAQGSGAGSNVQMRLPAGFQVGDQLQLTLMSREGARPSFSVGLLASQETVTLSDTAKLLEKIITTNQQQPKVTGTTPLLPSSNQPDTTQLTAQLIKTVDNSGVFYESHLRQWNDGERNLEQIRQEPQNRPDATVDSNNNMVPMQLDSLENQRFVWQGEVWPGQVMEWEVNKDDSQPSSPASKNEKAQVWQSVVKFQLPQLGQVNATIRLQGDHVQLQVNVQNPETAASLKAATDKLALALAASGTELDNMTVQNDATIGT